MLIEIRNKLVIDITDDLLKQIVIAELTCDNPEYVEAKKAGRSTRGILPLLKNFSISNGKYLLPRGYLSRLYTVMFELGLDIQLKDSRSVVPLETKYSHSISLRDYQIDALTNLSRYTEGVLSSPAGSGKTVMGSAAILMCGQKSLWITHTKQLLFQFVDRFTSFVDIPKEDIGLIHEGNWVTDKPITAALIQTLRSDKDKLAAIANNFGTIIVDECHHQPSDTFTEVVANLNPFYLYGLTATYERRDGLESLLFQNVGPIRHAVPRSAVASQTITPTIIKRFLDIPGIPEETTYHKLLQFLQESRYRNTIICQDVLAQAVKGNICIVLTERVSHAELLFKNLKKLWPKTGCIHGKHTQKTRQQTLEDLESGEITVLVCTSQLLGEGFDHPPLNRLFLTLPIRDPSKCEQLVGRIQRVSPGKTDAYLFDYVDNHGLTKHQYQNFGTLGCRYNVYKKLGCIIK